MKIDYEDEDEDDEDYDEHENQGGSLRRRRPPELKSGRLPNKPGSIPAANPSDLLGRKRRRSMGSR